MLNTNAVPQNLLAQWDVLVVDDDPYSLQVATIILSHYGAQVATATNGQEGLESARRLRPRLIIADLSMPVLDGWGMVEQLKKDRATMDIPAIALTAHAMIGDRAKAMAAGFHNYLTKPLTPSTFMNDLMRLLVDIPELSGHLNMGD
ncbi:MAG: response regulator [Burkholderiales bacterium]|nr:response regulator [Anaerolineae bacterium]